MVTVTHLYITDIHKINRSYGVVLWEITSYGDAPLDDMEAKDIVEAAQDGTLQHSRSVPMAIQCI